MAPENEINTRIWWDGSEVDFIRWTDKALVFSWGNVTETAVQMPRGAVVRLLQKGVLQIEGETPEWIHLSPTEFDRSPEAEATLAHPPAPRAACQPRP
jgi:hypothetical protein